MGPVGVAPKGSPYILTTSLLRLQQLDLRASHSSSPIEPAKRDPAIKSTHSRRRRGGRPEAQPVPLAAVWLYRPFPATPSLCLTGERCYARSGEPRCDTTAQHHVKTISNIAILTGHWWPSFRVRPPFEVGKKQVSWSYENCALSV